MYILSSNKSSSLANINRNLIKNFYLDTKQKNIIRLKLDLKFKNENNALKS